MDNYVLACGLLFLLLLFWQLCSKIEEDAVNYTLLTCRYGVLILSSWKTDCPVVTDHREQTCEG